MKYIKENELADKLRIIGLKEGDTVMVHSSLFLLGLLEGYKPAEQAEAYFRILTGIIGEGGTVMAPAFNFDFCKGKLFHRQNTPSLGMGVLSEFLRTHKKAIRSKHPMQSVTVLGDQSEWITEPDTESSFSPDGPFHRFIELNGKLLFLGSSILAAALIHWVEERQEVPYRYWKTFSGEYIDDSEGIHEVREYKMFARNLTLNPILNLQPIENRLNETGRLNEIKIGMGSIKLMNAKAFIQAAHELLELDPFSLLNNVEEIRSQF